MTSPTTTCGYDKYGDEIYQYDANANDPNSPDYGALTTFTYDALGRQTSETLPDYESDSMVYNNLGQETSSTDYDGTLTSNTYDDSAVGGGRLTTSTFTAAGHTTQSVVYTFDNLGREKTVTDDSGTTTNSYDAAGNLIQQVTPEGTINYAYNNLNQQTEVWTGSTTNAATAETATSYAYDAMGRLTTTTQTRLNNATVNLATTEAYDLDGNLARELLPNGVTNTYTYDSLNRLLTVNEMHSTLLLLSDVYTLNADGLRTSVQETQKQTSGTISTTNSYGYDNDGRLTSETDSSSNSSYSFANTFTYDLVGNRLTENHTGPGGGASSVTTNTYSGDNQLMTSDSSVGGWTQNSYDANGSLIESQSNAGTNTYTFDLRNRMVSATVSGVTSTDVYDDAGDRVQETVSGTTTYYLTDANNPTGYAQPIEQWVGTSRSSATLGMSYILGDRVLAQETGAGTISYLLVDGLDNTRALATSAGTSVTATFIYDSSGDGINFTLASAPTAILFQQTMYDAASGLNVFGDGTRDAEPGQDSFIEQDTPGYSDNQYPLTLNLTLLDDADQINMRDPSGHSVTPDSNMGDLAHLLFYFWVLAKGGIAEQPLSATYPDISADYANRRPDGLFLSAPLTGFYELKPIAASEPGIAQEAAMEQLTTYSKALQPYGVGPGYNDLFLGAPAMTPVPGGDFTYLGTTYRVTFYGADPTAFGSPLARGLIYYSLDVDRNMPRSLVQVPSNEMPANLRYPRGESVYLPALLPGLSAQSPANSPSSITPFDVGLTAAFGLLGLGKIAEILGLGAVEETAALSGGV